MNNKLFFTLLMVAQFVFPKINYGQAPNLGSASNFSIFTNAGAIGIGETTTILGDVGNHVGAFSIAPTSTITGTIYNADASTLQVALDIANVYSDLITRPCEFSITGSSSLGTIRNILGPDTVFCLAGAQSLGGDLTLDGQNNSNSIFIIQIDGAFSTFNATKVILINSAAAHNVFWQVNGAVSLGVNSTFIGNIVANGAISLEDGAVINGRIFSIAGEILLTNNVVVGSNLTGGPLPVSLTNFIISPLKNNILLQWTTASEKNNDYFIVQRSKDGLKEEDLIKIQGSGNSALLHNYSAIDYQPLDGTSYYRLVQTDYDGTKIFSDYVSIQFKSSERIRIYPNYFNTAFTITIPNLSEQHSYVLKIYNVLGEEMINMIIQQPSTIIDANQLISGIYFYTIISNESIIDSGQLSLNK